ncbi:MAG TPA: ATP-binding protein [Corynebacteriales bacterium]|nr:ATP-binding protein [Mycobacteriales bacterium]
MSATWIEIEGLRGFAKPCRISLAAPTGKAGSGLTILVGPNNSGKSTVIEAINAMVKRHESPSFAEGKRNIKTNRRIQISLGNERGAVRTLRTVESGGSETEWIEPGGESIVSDMFVLPSRRAFNPFFGKYEQNRDAYIQNYGLPSIRGMLIDHFSARIFHMLKNREEFSKVLARVLKPLPDWTVELSDSNQYYLKFCDEDQEHSSDGLGEGLISLFFIIDALYDSKVGSVIVIDEPELSLHPSLQKRLAALLVDYAKDRQIIIATHSPYFIDWKSIRAGAKIVRIVKEPDGIAAHELKAVDKIEGLLNNINNPHILGLDAREVFFLEDGVILVEGQEDVICYGEIARQLNVAIHGEFYGWGVGGAGNMKTIAGILKELGFKKVAGILDNNMEEQCESLSKEFLDYRFFTIPTDDVRSKSPILARDAVHGLLDDNHTLRQEYHADMRTLFENVNSVTM